MTKKATRIGFYFIALFVFSTLLSCKPKKNVATTVVPSTNNQNNFPISRVGDDTATAYVLISTTFGNIKLKLYNETPLHKNNFIKLVNQGFYDSLLFHRVISSFMIQGGDPSSKNATSGTALGMGDIGYTIPAEFNTKLFHKRGTICAAREGDDVNPEKASSGCQFYIVQGKKFQNNDLKQVEYRINRHLLSKITKEMLDKPENQLLKNKLEYYKKENKTDSMKIIGKLLDDQVFSIYEKNPHYTFSKQQTDAYATVGGAPHLDGSYTVFGEVVEGMEVVDKIAEQTTDNANRPISDIRMKIKQVKN